MNKEDFKTGMRVVYKGEYRPGFDTSPELEGKLGTVDTGLPCDSTRCVGVMWDDYKDFGVYPWNIQRVMIKGRNKL